MAAETSPNASVEQLTSEAPASRSSSKKFAKRRHLAPEVGSSSDEQPKHGAKKSPKSPRLQNSPLQSSPRLQQSARLRRSSSPHHSGYSSSNESSAEEQRPTSEDPSEGLRHRSVASSQPPVASSQPPVASSQPPVSQPPAATSSPTSQDQDIAEWELVEHCGGSDLSWTGNESSDEFWKAGKIDAEPLVAEPKKRRKAKGGSWLWPGGHFGVVAAARAEWVAFKLEFREEAEHIRRVRNRCVIGLLLVFIFCGLGGLIFHSVEGAFEMRYKCGVKRVKRDFVDTLWSKSHYMREEEWKSMARGRLMEFENQLYDAYEAGLNTYSGQKAWSFLNSFVYCVTLVTTIGYGHIAPATTIGRIITIVYSLFGIPLFLILLADYGKLFTRVIKYFWAYVRRLYYTGSCRKVRKTVPVQEVVKGVQLVFDMTKIRKSSASKEPDPNFVCPTSPSETPALSTYTIDDEFNLPISVAVSILLLYMLSGAALFMKLENWKFFESFYFVYISVSTIGFGDMVPSSEITVLLCSLVYFVFGLSLTSMCINVITEKLTDSFRQATAKIGATMGFGIDVPEEDAVNGAKPNTVIIE